MSIYPNPLIEQRADPFIYRHSDGYYYFIASVRSTIAWNCAALGN
ncbi:Alpha-N-arabinofuranosidase 2 precursor [Serratia fonticola]|uniref:Alpha-N-arabinofuranosidase 2 n=1 Tax=Serratia fonticola TaxID=47917 RepID=A0A4U9UG38_SERFO|nr:Alpha-N-arabinofuranosidase 2 precursor [Serratia fonticola]